MTISRRDSAPPVPSWPAAMLGRPRWARALQQAAPVRSPVHMINGASAAGLNFVLRNSAAGRKYQVETFPAGWA